MAKSRLEETYRNELRPELVKSLDIKNIMDAPKIEKIVLNIGVKDAVGDSRILQKVMNIFDQVAGQKSVRTIAKKSIAGFKIREGMPLGTKVTLRRTNMYEFLDRLINLALPNMRDFQGVSTKLDGRGNYNLGIKDWIIFPELDYGALDKTYGMNITIHTSTSDDKEAYELIKSFGMPFKKQTK
ncbi:50S ribosomal protein L5 [bacterium]|jgi:large subunit ribosomal protein L5|nr:50S ribosomal protein L5 [bacterium]MBT5015201.1 50S ribosomal protein L5 [bacterium]